GGGPSSPLRGGQSAGTRLEPETRRALLRLGAATGPARGPDDDFLALAHVAPQHFGRGAVAQPERERDRCGLAVGADDPDAAGGATSRFADGCRHLIVARLLRVGEDLADAHALGFADL